MITDNGLLKRLRDHIEEVGKDFKKRKDYFYWREEHFREILLHSLWQDPELWLKHGSGEWYTPLSQPEFPTKSGGSRVSTKKIQKYNEMNIGDTDSNEFTLIARRGVYSVWRSKGSRDYHLCDDKYEPIQKFTRESGEKEAMATLEQLPTAPFARPDSPVQSDRKDTQQYYGHCTTETGGCLESH
jgi:hypothetical protein